MPKIKASELDQKLWGLGYLLLSIESVDESVDEVEAVQEFCTWLEQLETLIEEQQQIQMTNPPSSEAWLAASKEIKRLITLLIGKAPKDARG